MIRFITRRKKYHIAFPFDYDFNLNGKKNGKREPNAMIVIERLKKRVFRYIPPKFIPSDSFEKEYNHEWLHVLGLDLKGKFWPLEALEAKEGRTPIDLYMARHCADEVDDVYGLNLPLSEKIKWGIFVGLDICIIIVVFLIASSGGVPK